MRQLTNFDWFVKSRACWLTKGWATKAIRYLWQALLVEWSIPWWLDLSLAHSLGSRWLQRFYWCFGWTFVLKSFQLGNLVSSISILGSISVFSWLPLATHVSHVYQTSSLLKMDERYRSPTCLTRIYWELVSSQRQKRSGPEKAGLIGWLIRSRTATES